MSRWPANERPWNSARALAAMSEDIIKKGIAMTESSVGSSVSGGDAADVLIIGAGVSGSVAAMHLAEAGFTVVCLEQGITRIRKTSLAPSLNTSFSSRSNGTRIRTFANTRPTIPVKRRSQTSIR
jgi:alanine dehydrogenase